MSTRAGDPATHCGPDAPKRQTPGGVLLDLGSGLADDLAHRHGRERRLQVGDRLFRSGSSEHALYRVLSGSISVQTEGVLEETPLLMVLEPCHWFDELSSIDGIPRSHDAVADQQSLVWCVPQEPLETSLDAHPRHLRETVQLVSGKLRIAFQIFDLEIRSPMTERVARQLRMASLGWGSRERTEGCCCGRAATGLVERLLRKALLLLVPTQFTAPLDQKRISADVRLHAG